MTETKKGIIKGIATLINKLDMGENNNKYIGKIIRNLHEISKNQKDKEEDNDKQLLKRERYKNLKIETNRNVNPSKLMRSSSVTSGYGLSPSSRISSFNTPLTLSIFEETPSFGLVTRQK